MTRRFSIKREIRSLGIDLCNPGRIIGTVVRGGLYLDGIAVFSPKPKQWSASIARAVVRTRFYPELKLIMTHDPEGRIKARLIEKITGLPVIEINVTGRRRSDEFETFKVGKKELSAKSSLDAKTVQEIFATTWTTGSLPESLRIAHLIAKSRFLGKERAF